jgi:ribosomal protein S18 acetylase RimI-like enzyme
MGVEQGTMGLVPWRPWPRSPARKRKGGWKRLQRADLSWRGLATASTWNGVSLAVPKVPAWDVPLHVMFQTIQLRRMRPSEAIVVSRLMRRVILDCSIYNEKAKRGESAKYTPTELRNRIKEDADAVFVAVAGRKIVGFCVNRKDDGLLLLEWYGVDPVWRQHGLGRRLVEKLIGTSRRRGCHKLWCDTNIENVGSQKLLCALGFQPQCTLHNHWYGQDFILWERPVPKMAVVSEEADGEEAARPMVRSFASRGRVLVAARSAV